MRIAYVCADPGVPVFGQKGCSIHVQEILRAFLHQGAEVMLFATRLGGSAPPDLADIPLCRLPSIPRGDRATREEIALSINPDLTLELSLAGPFDLVYERYSLWSYGAMTYAQAAGIPGLLEVNAPLIEEQAEHRGLVHRQEAEQVAERAFRSATALIAVSAEVKRYLQERTGGDRPIHVVPNGVNPQRFAQTLQPTAPQTSGAFTVGFVGTLKPWHGLPHLIDAFETLIARVPEARLLLVGDGPEGETLKGDIRDRGLAEAVEFTGAVAPEAVPGLLAAMDVAIAPYPAGDRFYFSPLKVYEYMAAGLPVVASRLGQLEELIESGVNGVLCPPGNSVALAETLEHLWRSPDLRQRLGQAARRTVIQRHTWDAVAQRILALAQSQPAVSSLASGGKQW